MGDLRDAFKKAGLIDDKADRRLKHEERVHRGELGRDGLEAKKRAEEEDRRRRDEQKRADAKAAQERIDRDKLHSGRRKQLEQELLRTAQRTGGGPRRFHYREPDGHLPYVLLDDDGGRRLETGEVALVRLADRPEVVLCPRALATELAALAPERLLHAAGGGSEGRRG